MGGGVGAVWEAGESLVVRVVAFNSVPELPRLRSLHRYRVTPPAPPNAPPVFHPPLQSAVRFHTTIYDYSIQLIYLFWFSFEVTIMLMKPNETLTDAVYD